MLIASPVQELLAPIGAYAAKLGIKAWVVGGAVRDFYLGKTTTDIDLTFSANQESVVNFCLRMWGGNKRKFSQFGTYRLQLDNGFNLDMARLRRETYELPGTLPEVTFSTSIKEDLFRRDFTVNAWALSILPDTFGKSHDPFYAQKDIDKGLIRILHEKSFEDDPTRLFRALRFAGRFDWQLAPKTQSLLRQAVAGEYPLLLSRQRCVRELLKILQEPVVKPIFERLEYYDLLKFFWPGLTWVPALEKTSCAQTRLGILVLSLGKNGEDFLKSLFLPHTLSRSIDTVWKLVQEQKCPLQALTPGQKDLLQVYLPSLPQRALDPCVVHGGELKATGLHGRHISTVMEAIRRAQWQGKISSKQEALRFAQTE